jgi:hypothetical protein
MPPADELGRRAVRTPRTLAEAYRHFATGDAVRTSPLHQRVAVALSESDEAMRAIATAPAGKRHPTVILAALHDLVLDGRAPVLARAYVAGDGDAAADAAVDTVIEKTDAVVAVAARRRPWADATAHATVLHPAIAEAAHRAGTQTVGLVDVGCSAGLDLIVDRVGISYGNGQSLGDPASPVQLSASVVGDRRLPERAMPDVVARVGIDREPIDVADPAQTRWLRACLPPDQPQRAARLESQLALAATVPRLLLPGDAVEVLPDALARVPEDALPVVLTTWALSRLPQESRLHLLHLLLDAAARRPVAWVSAEGVGVAPAVPTLGDRRASGHSILGVAVLDGSALHAEAVGRCWSQGRVLSWLAD